MAFLRPSIRMVSHYFKIGPGYLASFSVQYSYVYAHCLTQEYHVSDITIVVYYKCIFFTSVMGTKTHTFHSKNPAQGIHNCVALGLTSHNSIFVGVRTIFVALFIFSQHYLPIYLFIGGFTCLLIYKNRILVFYLEQDIRHKQRLIPTMTNKFLNYRQPSFRIVGNHVYIHCYLIVVTVTITSVCLEEQK
jgi:hypothetical protein